MKRIFVVRRDEPRWDVIVRRLERVHARMIILEPQTALPALERRRPDLLLLGEEEYGALPADGVVRLVICADVPPGRIIRGREGRNTVLLGWPAVERDFLMLTSRLLHVPERRTYRTPVRIAPGDGAAPLEGESEDFSLTGMAFRSEGFLMNRDEVTVFFRGGETGADMGLGIRLVRTIPMQAGGKNFYGGRFVHLQPADRHALEQFVWRIR